MAFVRRLSSSATLVIPGRRQKESFSNYDDIQLCNSIWPALIEAYPLAADQYAHLATYAKERVSRLQLLHPQKPTTDVIALIKYIHGLSSQPKNEVLDMMERMLPAGVATGGDRNVLIKTLEVSASLCLTTTITIDRDSSTTNPMAMTWNGDESLQSMVESQMVEKETWNSFAPEPTTIDERLTVRTLVSNFGFEVDWTNDINEHLNIDESTRVLSIYEHKIWLYAHLRPNSKCALPRAVLEECLDTLNLLFPHHDPQTASFLKSRGRVFHLLGSCGRKLVTDARNYSRWGANIDQLMRILDGPQSGFRQLLPRPREGKLLDLVNFWIALSVALLTAVSFIFGLLSVIFAKMSYDASMESLQLTRDQYLLSLAQACSDPSRTSAVHDFCEAHKK